MPDNGVHTFPVDIGVQPIAQAWVGKPVTMRVTDNGTLALRVHAEPVVLKAGCNAVADFGVKIRPASFVIYPHHGQNVTVTVPAQFGDYGVLFSGVAQTRGEPVTLASAVGSQVTTKGHLTCGGRHDEAAGTVAHSGFPMVPVILGVLLFALVVVVGRKLVRH